MTIEEKSSISANILVFDSGVGGLTLVPHIRHRLPEIHITYLADNALFPYGILEAGQLTDRVVYLIDKLCRKQPIDLVVVGCNSASTLVLPALREKLSIPVVGVVPAIKPAATHSQSKVIGLLATPGTIQREYTDELIAEFAEHCQVIRVGSNALVEAVERQLYGEQVDPEIYQQLADEFAGHAKGDQLDTVVLACTHFPHAVEQLQTSMPHITHWVDSGEAIARRVEHLLTALPHASKKNKEQSKAYFTATKNLLKLKPALQQFGFELDENQIKF
jgi:glutamate racemase